MRVAIYPGTFDPITNGHMDIIERACKLFDKLIVAVAASNSKKPLFSLTKRVDMLNRSCEQLENVVCEGFDGLLADFAVEKQAKVIVRGLRMISDFEYEMQMVYVNKTLNPSLETVFFMPSLKNAFINSTTIRSILEHGGDVSHLIPMAAFLCINGKN